MSSGYECCDSFSGSHIPSELPDAQREVHWEQEHGSGLFQTPSSFVVVTNVMVYRPKCVKEKRL